MAAAAGPGRRRGARADSPGPRATRRGRSSRSPGSRCVVLGGQARRQTQSGSLLRARSNHQRRRRSRDPVCPEAAVRAVPARLLLLCLLLRSSWLTVKGDRHVGAAGVLHRQGGRAAVAVSVGVAVGVPDAAVSSTPPRCSRVPRRRIACRDRHIGTPGERPMHDRGALGDVSGLASIRGGEISAHDELLHLDRQIALAEVYVRDAHDLLGAHTSRCSVFPPIDESVQSDSAGRARRRDRAGHSGSVPS
jgi:hypothetical protein